MSNVAARFTHWWLPRGAPVFTLFRPRAYRGRVAVAIPAGGIVLPEARGTVDSNGDPLIEPFTYAVANLPTGLAFAAATRTITGTPTVAQAPREITYTASDSSVPAKTVSTTFDFPIVAANAPTTLDDWDNGGYGLSTRRTLMLVLIESGADVGAGDANLDVFARPPRGNIGDIVLPSVLTDLELPGLAAPINRIRLHPATERLTINHSTSGVSFSGFRDNFAGERSFWLRHREREDEFPLTVGDSAGGGFLRVSGDDMQLQPRLDDGEHFIFALTDTS